MATHFKPNNQYMIEILKTLVTTPSPSGYCMHIMQLIKKEVENWGYTFEGTRSGGGIITVKGEIDNIVGLSAHIDTLGGMVRSINPSGTLRFTSVGGYMMESVEGAYCMIHTRDGKVFNGTVLSTKPSVHAYADARELKRIEEHMEIRIDEVVSSKEEVLKLGIANGDFISFDPKVHILENGFIKSRHLDDKAGVAILLGYLQHLHSERKKPKKTIKIIISTHEEVGFGGSYLPDDIEELIGIDMGVIGDDLDGSELKVSICAKDSSGPYHYEVISSLVQVAKAHQLDYALDIYPHYGSDVSAALRAGHNIRGGLIGPGVHASHGMERTHIKALENTLKLIYYYLDR